MFQKEVPDGRLQSTARLACCDCGALRSAFSRGRSPVHQRYPAGWRDEAKRSLSLSLDGASGNSGYRPVRVWSNTVGGNRDFRHAQHCGSHRARTDWIRVSEIRMD